MGRTKPNRRSKIIIPFGWEGERERRERKARGRVVKGEGREEGGEYRGEKENIPRKNHDKFRKMFVG